MASRSSRTSRRAFSAVEALIGIVVAAFLLGIAYWGLSTGLRLLARGESKLHATGQSEALFRRLRQDLDAALKPPAQDDERVAIRTAHGDVHWTFHATATGRGSIIERTAGREINRYLSGALTASRLTLNAADGRTSLTVALSSKGTHDAVAGEFCATFFPRGEQAESAWNSLGD